MESRQVFTQTLGLLSGVVHHAKIVAEDLPGRGRSRRVQDALHRCVKDQQLQVAYSYGIRSDVAQEALYNHDITGFVNELSRLHTSSIAHRAYTEFSWKQAVKKENLPPKTSKASSSTQKKKKPASTASRKKAAGEKQTSSGKSKSKKSRSSLAAERKASGANQSETLETEPVQLTEDAVRRYKEQNEGFQKLEVEDELHQGVGVNGSSTPLGLKFSESISMASSLEDGMYDHLQGALNASSASFEKLMITIKQFEEFVSNATEEVGATFPSSSSVTHEFIIRLRSSRNVFSPSHISMLEEKFVKTRNLMLPLFYQLKVMDPYEHLRLISATNGKPNEALKTEKDFFQGNLELNEAEKASFRSCNILGNPAYSLSAFIEYT